MAWEELSHYLIESGYNYDGSTTGYKYAKSLASTTGWNTANGIGVPGNDPESNNSSGFSGRPGGSRTLEGTFDGEGRYASWWFTSFYVTINYNEQVTSGGDDRDHGVGHSIRCIKL